MNQIFGDLSCRKDYLTRLLPSAASLLAFLNAYPVSEAKTNSQTGDVAPPAVQKLVPKDWTLESFALGPLLPGARKDLAMSISHEAEGAFGNAKARELIVAAASGSGYKIVARGAHALQRGLGPAGTDPFIYSSNHEIITEAFGGSRYKFTEYYHFALKQGKWRMTRYRLSGFDSLMESHASNTIDVNVLTGHVVGTMSRDGHKTKRVAFNEIYSLQCAKGRIIPSDAPKLRVADATNQCSASIRSGHTVNEIIIEATVTPADDSKDIRVSLKDNLGKTVRVKRRQRVALEHGFKETLLVALPDDQNFDHEESSNVFLNWIVCFEQIDKSNPRVRTRFSTESPGRRGMIRGGILALTQSSVVTMQNAAVDNGSFQSPPIDTSEDL